MSIDWYEKLRVGNYEEIISSIHNTQLVSCSDYEYIVGTALLGLKRSKSALPFLKKAIQKDPLDAATKFNYAKACENNYLYVEAIESYKQLIQGGANSAAIYIALADLLRNNGNYEEAVDLLRSAPSHLQSNIDITAELALCLAVSGDSDSAIKLFENVSLNMGEEQKAFHIKSRIYKIAGDLEKSIHNCRCAIDLLKVEKTMAHKKPLVNKAKKYLPVEIARKTLLRLTKLMTINNFSYFLAYGTLLGVIRDGDILAHDKDLDLGLFWDADRVKLIEVLEKNDFIVKSNDKLDINRSEWCITAIDKITGVGTDLFFFKPHNDKYLSGFYHRPAPLIWEFPIFEIETLSYAGEKVYVPKDPKIFLNSIYGANWNVSDPYFDSVVSGCNIAIECTDIARSYGYLRLFYSIRRNNFNKAYGYCKQLFRIEKNDWLLSLGDWCLNNFELQIQSQKPKNQFNQN